MLPWEIAYNYLHNNYAKSGIHNFDQDIASTRPGCGQASGPIYIRNNVVYGQSGPGIYIGSQCNWDMDMYIENNIVIDAGGPVEWLGTGDPDASTQQTEPGGIVVRMSGTPPVGGYSGNAYIRNNIIWGWGWPGMEWYGQGCLSLTGSSTDARTDFSDNVCIATHDARFFGWSNNAQNQWQSVTGNRNAYYYDGAPPALPAFDANPIVANPLLTLTGSQIGVGVGSPIIDLSNTALLRDIYGRLRTKPNSNIGAVE